MKAGGRRRGVMPAQLYYYPGQTAGRPLERRDNLVFVIDLLAVAEGPQ